jgi:hypothetical protein
MEALLIVVGAVLAFLGSVTLQRFQQRRQGRATLFLRLLPDLSARLTSYAHIAHQDPRAGPLWFLKDDDWPYRDEADAIYRQAVLVSYRYVRRAANVRQRWKAFAQMVDPELGSPTEQILGRSDVARALDDALAAVSDYTAWLERGFLGRRRGT